MVEVESVACTVGKPSAAKVFRVSVSVGTDYTEHILTARDTVEAILRTLSNLFPDFDAQKPAYQIRISACALKMSGAIDNKDAVE